MNPERHLAEAALASWDLEGTTLTRLAGGLINVSYLVESARGRYVLQRLHPIFGPEVNEDIEAITSHLDARGLVTPRLVRTRDLALFVVRPDGVWRLQTFVEGTSSARVESPRHAEAAGRLVGRFHAALSTLRHEFRFKRAGVHDTARHFARLDEAVDQHRARADHATVARLRDELRQGLAGLPAIDADVLPRRIAHGDLKISNLLFDGHGEGVCLVDLDTLAEMPLPFELGDAWRSWCNPVGEDSVETRFEGALFAAAWRGYATQMQVAPAERALLVPGVLTICLELAARFACDVLEDRYFGWDQARFPSRAAHNLVRAQGQAQLYRSLFAQRAATEALLG
jgi:Ser/Thr protein kinase RdoA (MazF antagonist)